MRNISAKKLTYNFSPVFVLAVGLLIVLGTNRSTQTLMFAVGLFTCIQLAHLAGFVVAGMLAKARVESIHLFFGKKLASFTIGEVTFTIGSIPVGGSVVFEGMNSEATEDNELTGYNKLPLSWRLTIIASGPLAVFLLASLCIGSAEAAHSLLIGFGQVVQGALSPLSQGQVLLSKAETLLSTQGAITLLGVLSAKMAASNLLPLPTLNGGQLIMALLNIVNPRQVYQINLIGILCSGLIFSSWLIALCAFTLKHMKF